jgi:hypothetical protein
VVVIELPAPPVAMPFEPPLAPYKVMLIDVTPFGMVMLCIAPV